MKEKTKQDLVILKLGTSVLTHEDGTLDGGIFAQLAEQVAKLRNRYRVAIVSSGAVAAGRHKIGAYDEHEVGRKAAAAIGNHHLIKLYGEVFALHGVHVAQILCDRSTFTDSGRLLTLQATLTTLWRNNILPILNENDVMASHALSFTDNDELAAMLAISCKAKQLLIGSSVAGLLNNGKVVARIDDFSDEVLGLVSYASSVLGKGGMASKLRHAKEATASGVGVVIFDARKAGNILRASRGQTGTLCSAANEVGAEL